MLYNAWHALEHLLALQRCLVAISGKTAASEQQAVSFPIAVLRPCTSKLNRIDRHKAVAHLFRVRRGTPFGLKMPASWRNGIFDYRTFRPRMSGQRIF
jgi:hypothetical protein